MIVDVQDSSWMTDGHRLKWCIELGKHYCPCFIKLGVVQLCIFVSCKLLHMKSSVSNAHVDFREIWKKKKRDLNYFTRVNTGAKIDKNNKVVYLFFPSLKQTPITNYKVCRLRRPQVCAFSNKQTLAFVFITRDRRHARRASASCRHSIYHFPQTMFRHHSKIRRQLQPKADKTLFLKYRLRLNFSLAIRAKKK